MTATAELAENIVEKVISVVDERDKFIHAMDLSFGAERLSHKNMWKKLKTAVKETGDIKDANTDRLGLEVTERPDETITLMEFRSFKDYLSSEMKNINEDAWEKSGTSLAHEIADDPAAAEQVQGNISPHRAVSLLSETA
ncbi:MAG: hypothetical protein ABIF19_11745 [Planctomycetota bacterium]